ncbi:MULTISPECIES: hypothetical protein [unclassified Sinorhizobium]|uniref:hypothetical protein n=1 Tax=unclassified Sinorhizobium TaxID=2613772 RepID=UPI0024C2A9C0|nr:MULTISPECIES: hypothetical protein [unclassified Sinorhizobium]MDK1378559.1 hypothetical protein [Sinorhizobium sp. 6-70]MDK1482916.1 hypothetical protein [Sinorhizobium sp. 6-117]
MEFVSKLIDKKIMGLNIAAVLTIDEYFLFAPAILDKNTYQRKKVKSSGKTYDLLRDDLIQGCVIPPIILAVSGAYGNDLDNLVKQAIEQGDAFGRWAEIFAYIERAARDGELLILDGLQRTLTINGILNRGEGDFTGEQIASLRNNKIRIEVYVGLSKPGILYRMLTLNTGQTPMSFRHQLEILYNDYIDNADLPGGIEVVREVDDARARGVTKYKYADVIDMFYAYSTGSPMPYTKQGLVGELKELNFLENFRFTPANDDMKQLLIAFNLLAKRIEALDGDWAYRIEEEPADEGDETVERPFATNTSSLFSRAQFMTGFGAECQRLIEQKQYPSIADIGNLSNGLYFSAEPHVALDQLIEILDRISKKAKRIGDAQRAYAQFAFRAMLNPNSDSYLDLSKCWLSAEETYQMMF